MPEDFEWPTQTMRPLSGHLLRSFDLFSAHIKNSHNEYDILIYNISLVVNCAAYIETQTNQKLEMYKSRWEMANLKNNNKIPRLKKTAHINDKWDYLFSVNQTSEKWDKSKTVFSNFSALINLRNEILHYKSDFMSAGDTPTKRIRSIMMQVCDEQPYGKKPYHKQMHESWCSYLLKHKKLAEWCITTTKNLEKIL